MLRRIKSRVYQWKVVLYLSGFVRVFHSGGLLYVNFCCVDASRLLERERKSKNCELILTCVQLFMFCHFAAIMQVSV